MMKPATLPKYRRVAVIDIGKTNAKLVVVDAETGKEIAVRKTANSVLAGPPYPHFDIEALWQFILETLADFARVPGFDALSITTHGASAALLDENGDLALPVLDYEHLYPQDIQSAYETLRPAFAETYSPKLAGGLNVGAQLHYLQTAFPNAFTRVATILTYPQYWAYRLTGIAANEGTSLGCHTDLWQPFTASYSSLVDRLGVRKQLAPVRSAFDALGDIQPELAERLGLPKAVPVYCGIHDSNASLLPHLLGFGSPCSVISTGTWGISFGVGAKPDHLDPNRDNLVNVDAYGSPVPTARFMGGREWDMLTRDLPKAAPGKMANALNSVLDKHIMLLPSVVEKTGPYPDRKAEWILEPTDPAERRVVASLYEALMTVTCLELIGADSPLIVEGPFASNDLYLEALHSLTGRPVFASEATTGTAIGAALLTGLQLKVPMHPVTGTIEKLKTYAAIWRERANGGRTSV